jgi:hypothetical protein
MKELSKTLIGAALVVIGAAHCVGNAAVTAPTPDMKVEFDAPSDAHIPKGAVREWLQRSHSAVAHYFGQFPISKLLVTIHDTDGDEVGYGSTTWEHGHGWIEINVGDDASAQDVLHDWTATHEMTHLAFPIVPRQDRWVAEGMATYIEPIARLQAGQLTREEIWSDFLKNGPRALPTDGSGFRGTRTIGQMYWGGAVWCLLADIEIRQKTNNRFGFQDAMRAVVTAHATADSDYSAEQALQFGDKAIGVDVLVPLYKRFSAGPINVNLENLWHSLGIVRSGWSVRFDENAPLAYIRRSIEIGPK